MNTQWKLRRLAPRAIRVLDRHADREAALGAYNKTLRPAAEAYMDTYDRIRTMNVTQAVELAEGKAAVENLLSKMGSWAAQIAALEAIPGFERGAYGDNPSVPDDVIADAESFLAVVTEQLALDPESMPYGEELIADMGAALERAKAEWNEAGAVRSEWMLLVQQNRNNARKLAATLVGFRQSLVRVVGRTHPDYQSLRAAKIDRAVLERGEAEDLPDNLIPSEQAPSDEGTEVLGTEEQGELEPTG